MRSERTLPAAIFWDMDGTLTDSEPIWGEATYRMSELLGKRLTPQLRAKTVGGTFDNAFDVCARHAGYEEKPGDREYYREMMSTMAIEGFKTTSVVFPGIRELLGQCKADGIPMLITTNTVRRIAQPVIDDIGVDFFVDTICGDDVACGKPDPEMYLTAARKVGAEPADCLVFEDSHNGMLAASAAGCVTIGLPADATTEVPPAVTPISTVRADGGTHLSGATAADIYSWFAQLHRA